MRLFCNLKISSEAQQAFGEATAGLKRILFGAEVLAVLGMIWEVASLAAEVAILRGDDLG
jgi:hypothetical protein